MSSPAGPDPAGRIALSDYVVLGNVVLRDLWRAWCPPCRSEAHTLEAISE
ncbi:peroxiredoxin family protein [Amycolatopsis sp. cmx-4-61]